MAFEKLKGQFKSEDTESLHNLFLHQLEDIYNAEKQLVKAMPELRDTVATEDLRMAISEHLEETENQVIRLEQVFTLLEESPRTEHCDAMRGLIRETKQMIGRDGSPLVRDAGLISIARKIEHYEISSYEDLVDMAEVMGHMRIAGLLRKTLAEEENANATLNAIGLEDRDLAAGMEPAET